MLSLERRGLLDNGDYFVVGVDLEQYSTAEPDKYLRGILNNVTEEAAFRAYHSYLAIVPSPAVEFDEFAKQVRAIGLIVSLSCLNRDCWRFKVERGIALVVVAGEIQFSHHFTK